MCWRREVLRKLGGFRTNLGRRVGSLLGSEETELLLRLRRIRSNSISFVPGAIVFHHVNPKRLDLSYLLTRYFMEGYSKGLISAMHRAENSGDLLDREWKLATRMLLKVQSRGWLMNVTSVSLAAIGYLCALLSEVTFNGTTQRPNRAD